MYKVGDTVKVKQNLYKLSKETISKLKEEYGHCLSERQLKEIREEQDDFSYKGVHFQKEDLKLVKEYDEVEVYIYHYDSLWETYRGYCSGKYNLEGSPIYEKEHFQDLRMNEFGKEWDEVWFRSGWFISE
jgi:hypothetical protein